MVLVDINSRRPEVHALVKARAKMVSILTVILLVLLTFNLMLLSSLSKLGALPVTDAAPITLSLVTSIFVIFVSVFITLFYIIWANTYLDKLTIKARAALGTGEQK